jgi:hypothetical protein
MCDPAGQLADQIELLSVPERGLRLAAIGDLVGEAPVGLGELTRSLGYQLFEITVDPSRFLLCSAHSKQRVYCGDELIRLDRLDQIGVGAAI